MVPLCYPEIDGLNLEKAMLSGFLPPHYLSPDPQEDLRAYIADYLKEEIAAEALVQNIPSLSGLKSAKLTIQEIASPKY